MREQLAHQAARLMAEGGITDYAFAKRKAAKQLGAEDTQHLPSNDEVEMALRSFRALYQSESHPLVLHKLRQQALATMQLLEPFHPFLTGSVLKGTAGEQSDINLLVYSDDEKAMMMFLLKHNLSFEGGEWSIHLTGRQQTVPSFMLKTETGVPVNIAVLPENARHSGSRKIGKQADMATVKRLLSESVNTE
ncbi:nucleotidyltransferase domain-containing protein [Candidatus Nitrotoga sp. HW29]|uniref:nucleotidyltransferase domain-containing protein n=1 Tax=Candidatus Nitrotoga sp. HW29 TaxID=2886963 RepID=UPI001EF38818|nr:nucleotidyltransferase domain-containing protein [Candidatus Nitrotoga sp. HW29]